MRYQRIQQEKVPMNQLKTHQTARIMGPDASVHVCIHSFNNLMYFNEK